MARDRASIRLDMWADEDWRALTVEAQRLYMLLLSHPTLSYAGVADWRPGRLAQLSAGTSKADVEKAADELEAHRFVIRDDDTEEVLIRSFIKHDGLMKQPKLVVSMTTAFAAIASQKIREVVAFEVQKLHEKQPDLKWSVHQVQTILAAKASDIGTFTPGFTPAVTPNGGQGQGMRTTTATTTATSPEGDRRASRLPEEWSPSSACLKFASENGIDVEHEQGQFRAHAAASGRKQKDWDAAFRQWLGNAKKWARPERATPQQRAQRTLMLATELDMREVSA